MAKAAEESAKYENELRSPSEIAKRIRQFGRENVPNWRGIWEFEAAAQTRDEIGKLRERLLAV